MSRDDDGDSCEWSRSDNVQYYCGMRGPSAFPKQIVTAVVDNLQVVTTQRVELRGHIVNSSTAVAMDAMFALKRPFDRRPVVFMVTPGLQ